MSKSKSFSFLFLFLILIITGCSSSKSTPVIPDNPQADINLPATELDTSESSRSILGAWTLSINHETLEATVTPNRSLDRHYNVKYLIPTPEVVINTIHPNYVIDADVTLTNSYTFPAYDIRLIIFTDEYGHFLDNADVWTDLYDIPAGQDINPFKAYAKDQPNRIFEGETSHTENLLVFDPPPGHPIQFAIDASYPGNCEEPYAFENFLQGALHPHVGANAAATIDVLDWQHDVSEVFLQCPEITNEPETPFVYDSLNRWRLNLINNAGAGVGNYPAYLLARSSNSGALALHDKIIITVSSGIGIPSDPQIVGTIHPSPKWAFDIAVDNGYAYVATSTGLIYAPCGLQIFDISLPSNPVPLSTLNDFNSNRIEIDDEYVFICGGDRFYSINIQYPYSPQIADQTSISPAYDLAFEGNMAFVAGGEWHGTPNHEFYYTLCRHDVSDATDIQPAGIIGSYEQMPSVVASGDYAYASKFISSVEQELMIINIQSSIRINQVASDNSILWNQLATQGNYLYNCVWNGPFSIVDISDPLDPRLISSLGSLDGVQDIVVSGNYAYLLDSNIGVDDQLLVVDICDPLYPYIFRTLDLPSNEIMNQKIKKYDNCIYLITFDLTSNLSEIIIIKLW